MAHLRQHGWRKNINKARKTPRKEAQSVEQTEESTIDSDDDEERSKKRVRWETGDEDVEIGEKSTTTCEVTDDEDIKLTNDKV